jgi:hypothetical protein
VTAARTPYKSYRKLIVILSLEAIMTKRNVALLVVAVALTGCASQSSFERAACVAPCGRDMSRAQFLSDIRQSGFESTRSHVLTTPSSQALAVADPVDTAIATTAYAVRLPAP